MILFPSIFNNKCGVNHFSHLNQKQETNTERKKSSFQLKIENCILGISYIV